MIMGRDGFLIGEVSRRSGASRKALRLYEEAGILPPPRRTPSGYRVYGSDALDLLAFVSQAQRRALSRPRRGFESRWGHQILLHQKSTPSANATEPAWNDYTARSLSPSSS